MIEDKRMILEQGRRKTKPVVATINVTNPSQLCHPERKRTNRPCESSCGVEGSLDSGSALGDCKRPYTHRINRDLRC